MAASILLPATEIPVSLFRKILFIPFAIRTRGGADALVSGEDLVGALSAVLDQQAGTKAWCQVSDPVRHLPEDAQATGTGLAEAYQEFVYFEPYVQRFLYGDPTTPQAGAPVRLYRRQDIRALDFAIPDWKVPPETWPRYRLRVERLNLYLFDTGNAILAVELAFDADLARQANAAQVTPAYREQITLKEALDIVESLRRTYPPFFDNHDGVLQARYPASLTWVTDTNAPTAFDPCLGHDAIGYIDHALNRRCPPMHPTWRALLKPAGGSGLPLEGYDTDCKVVLAQTGDDRAPFLLTVAVPDPTAISRPDWIRLCFADTPGDSNDYSYAEDFLDSFERDHCYDRFWQPGSYWKNTRYLVCGFGLTAVGQWHGQLDGFNYFRDVAAGHLRRHYFQLLLIAHFQKVALLTLSDRLSQALRRNESFAEDAHTIERDILRFTNRYWFEDISAQLQGQELFTLIRKHLRTRQVYDQLAREVSETNAFLNNDEQLRVALGTERLNKVAYPGLILAVITGFFGMNFFEASALKPQTVPWLLIVLALAVIIFLGIHTWFGGLQKWLERLPAKRVWWGAIAVLVFGLFLLPLVG
ncbi:MAG: hypothetical protein KF815_13000 [Rhodospirillales bacterium]|nr:hypothetical protein [Rhodospirillales bacterium]